MRKLKTYAMLIVAIVTVHLAWDASVSTEVTGYKLYYGGSSTNYSNVVNVGNVTEFTVSVNENNPLFFAVTAYDGNGNESDYSTELSCSTITTQTSGKGVVSVKQSDWSNVSLAKSTIVELGTGKTVIVSTTPESGYSFTAVKNNNDWLPPVEPYEFTATTSSHIIKLILQKGHSLSGVEWIK